MRRTIISTIYIAVAIVLAASCNKNENPVSPADKTVITAVAEQIGAGTKVEMAYRYDALWQTRDQIHVKQGQTTDTFTLVDGEGTTTGTFEGTKSISGEIEAFYPVSVGETMEWPAVQTNTQAVPMYAKQSISGTENKVVSFSSLGAMLQIAFSTKTEGVTITSITLEHNKKPLSGKFTVTDGQAIMAENAANPGVTLNLGESGVPVGVAATYFYIAIPAGTYSTPEKDEEMTITFKDDIHGKWCEMASTTFPNIARNTVGRITLAKDFKVMTFTVNFDMNGHEGTAPDSKTVEWGTPVTAPETPTSPNSIFVCWCIDQDCQTEFDFSKVVKNDITLYAKWEDASHVINGHDYVKLAGYYWATENVGEVTTVTSKCPATGNEWGCYYYSQANAKAAAESWGSEGEHKWTLPSNEQWDALLSKCYWENTDSYSLTTSPDSGRKGYIVYEAKEESDKGKMDMENSGYTPDTDTHIFLPRVGYTSTVTTTQSKKVTSQNGSGYYWASTDAYFLYFANPWSAQPRMESTGSSFAYYAVRPVSN